MCTMKREKKFLAIKCGKRKNEWMRENEKSLANEKSYKTEMNYICIWCWTEKMLKHNSKDKYISALGASQREEIIINNSVRTKVIKITKKGRNEKCMQTSTVMREKSVFLASEYTDQLAKVNWAEWFGRLVCERSENKITTLVLVPFFLFILAHFRLLLTKESLIYIIFGWVCICVGPTSLVGSQKKQLCLLINSFHVYYLWNCWIFVTDGRVETELVCFHFVSYFSFSQFCFSQPCS